MTDFIFLGSKITVDMTAAIKLKDACSLEEKLDGILNKSRQHIKNRDINTIIVGDCNTPLTPMDRSSKEKISKETQVLNDTLEEMDHIDIFRIFHPNAEEYTILFKCTWTILQDRPHLGSQIKPQ